MSKEQIAAAILAFERDVDAGKYGDPVLVDLRKLKKKATGQK